MSAAVEIPEFSFPLRQSPGLGAQQPFASHKQTMTHSRSYTGIEIPELTTPPSKPASPFGSLPSANSTQALKANNPHRKHAHKRSAAISQDFNMPGQSPPLGLPSSKSFPCLDMPPPLNAHLSGSSLNNSLNNSLYALQSPTLTFASSSSSSLPMQSSSSISSNDTDEQQPKEVPIQTKPVKHKKVKSLVNFFRKKNHSTTTEEIIPEPAFRDSEEPVFYSSSYVSTAELDHGMHLPEPEAVIDLDEALSPFNMPTSFMHRRTESAPDAFSRRQPARRDETIIEEEEDSPSNPPFVMGQQAASVSSTSLASSSSSSNRDRARLARNFNSLTLGPLLAADASNKTSEQAPSTEATTEAQVAEEVKQEDSLAHVKALHRLSSATNETITITPSVSHRPNSGIFDSPGTVRAARNSVYQDDIESIISEVSQPSQQQQGEQEQQQAQLPTQPFTEKNKRTSKFMTKNPAARFSISSLASFATSASAATSSTGNKRSSRMWSWMKGKRVSPKD